MFLNLGFICIKITSLETELLKAQMNKTEASMKDQETTKKVQDFQEVRELR